MDLGEFRGGDPGGTLPTRGRGGELQEREGDCGRPGLRRMNERHGGSAEMAELLALSRRCCCSGPLRALAVDASVER
jgi:hypothetical protein